MKINTENPIPISQQFIELLEAEINSSGIDSQQGVIINFRDPDYSSTEGGYHPVEVMVSATGRIQYVTDFAYVGSHYPELAKELDWDLMAFVFGHMGRDYPIEQGKSMFKIFQKNFIHYHLQGVFTVTVSSMA